MSSEIYHEYQSLSQKLIDIHERFMKAPLNDRERLWDELWQLEGEIWTLIKAEPELRARFDTLLDEHSIDRFVMRLARITITDEDFLEELRAFAHGEPRHFTDRNLRHLIDRYETYPAFQEACHADPDVWNAFTYWQAEYQRRMASDEIFAARVLLWKLIQIEKEFSISVAAEILRIPAALEEDPTCTRTKVILKDHTVAYILVNLDETERELLYRLYHTNPECRQILENTDRTIRPVLAYFLEEYQQRTLEQ